MDIAVIGISGFFPEAESVAAFYQNLRAGRDSVRKVSPKRINDTGIPADRDYQVYAYLENIDAFDYDFFNIPLGEATYMDPHQRLLLEAAYLAIENAGYNVDDLDGSRTCVYVGDTDQRYYELADEDHPTLLTGNLNATTAGRIARFFNLLGNAAMIDTACSSSLVALHAACNELRFGEADYALVGGASIVLVHNVNGAPDETGIDAADGKAKAFSAAANGTGTGEAVACVLLKPLDRALADGDHVQAIIKGSAVNQDGKRSSSLTAPSSIAQTEVIRAAWHKAGIDPGRLTYIESHGTGTPLGDPIEIEGITRAFAPHTRRKQFCAISSLKTNIGHTDTAAGLCGLVKVVLSLRHRELFPSLHFVEPNAFINFLDSPVYVNTRLRAWDVAPGQKRLAGLSSFGISGTNCHVVLEEAPAAAAVSDPQPNPPWLVTVSARSERSLELNLKALYRHLSGQPTPADLAAISYTLNAGRKHYRHRCAFIAGSTHELTADLLAALNRHGGAPPATPVEYWFLFSGDGVVESAQVTDFCRLYPAFGAIYQQCRARLASERDDRANRFAFQYALARLFAQLGIKVAKVIGTGTGRLVIDVLKEKATLEEALAKIAALPDDENHSPAGRMQSFVETKLAGCDALLIEMGPPGGLSRCLQKLVQEKERIEVWTTEGGFDLPGLLKKVYEQGADIRFAPLYQGTPTRRVELPGYAFDKKRCWIKPRPQQVEKDIRDWFYRLRWVAAPGGELPPAATTGTYLLVHGESAPARGVASALKAAGNRIIEVMLEPPLSAEAPSGVYVLDGRDGAAYTTLLASLASENIDGIINLSNLQVPRLHRGASMEGSLEAHLYSHFLLLKKCIGLLQRPDFKLVYVSANAQRVLPGDDISPVGHAAFGLYQAMQSEYPMLDVRTVDFDGQTADPAALGTCLLHELSARTFPSHVAYRQGNRYVREFEKVACPRQAETPVGFSAGSVYLITGGGSGVGLETAKFIAGKVQCTILVLGRRRLPPRAAWEAVLRDPAADPALKRSLQGLLQVEASGSTVACFSVDVGNAAAMAATFADITRQYPRLNGIIHSAGVMGPRVALENLSFAEFKNTLVPKIQGTSILDGLTQSYELDFFVLFSSLNTVVPQACTTDYNPANAFEDAYAQWLAARGVRAISINWGAWGETGAGQPSNLDAPEEASAGMRAWSNAEGLAALHAALGLNLENVAIGNIKPEILTENPFFQLGAGLRPAGHAEAPERIALPPGATGTESILLELWYQVLKQKNLDLSSNFFELGGHSLLAKRLLNLIKSELKVDVAFRNIFEYPTVKSLAAFIDRLAGTVSGPGTYGLQPLEKAPYYETSVGQKQVWLAHTLDDTGTAYTITQELLVKGRLHIPAFEEALIALVKRHEVFRTTFALEGGELVQQIAPPDAYDFHLEVIDLRNHAGREAALADLIHKNVTTAIDLTNGPIVRARLVWLAEQEYVFLFVTHHIIYDDWSRFLIMEEVGEAYHRISRGEPYRPEPLAIQYKEFAAWHNRMLKDPVLHQALKQYWLGQLGGNLPALELPLDRPRPAGRTYAGDCISFTSEESLRLALGHLARRHECSLFVVLLAALKILLSKYSGQHDIVVGTPVSNREDILLERQIGLFINLIPLRTRLSETDDFGGLLAKVKTTFLSAMEHKLFPFDHLKSALGGERSQNRAPVFDVLMVLNKDIRANRVASVTPEVVFEVFPGKVVNAPYDLMFEFYETSDALEANIIYNTDLFRRPTINLMKERFVHLLGQIIASPASTLRDFSLALKLEQEAGRRIQQNLNIEEAF